MTFWRESFAFADLYRMGKTDKTNSVDEGWHHESMPLFYDWADALAEAAAEVAVAPGSAFRVEFEEIGAVRVRRYL